MGLQMGTKLYSSRVRARGHRSDICIESVEVALESGCREKFTRAGSTELPEDGVIARLIEVR
jgi:hypothetical protein